MADKHLVTVEEVLLHLSGDRERSLRVAMTLKGSPAVAASARWVVERSYSELEELENGLPSWPAPPLPDKAALLAFQPHRSKASCAALQIYCQAILDEPANLTAAPCAEFFRLDSALWQDAAVTTGAAQLIQGLVRKRSFERKAKAPRGGRGQLQGGSAPATPPRQRTPAPPASPETPLLSMGGSWLEGYNSSPERQQPLGAPPVQLRREQATMTEEERATEQEVARLRARLTQLETELEAASKAHGQEQRQLAARHEAAQRARQQAQAHAAVLAQVLEEQREQRIAILEQAAARPSA